MRRRAPPGSAEFCSDDTPPPTGREIGRDMRSGCVRFPALNLPENSAMQVSPAELKKRIIESLRLQEVSPEQIDDDAPLFGSGLGLDSIDALELVVMLEKHYGIVIKDIEEGRPAFRSVRTLAEFIQARHAAQ